jgi:hypothetical protein
MGRPRKVVESPMLVATTDAVIDVEGVPFYLKRGVTRVRADHPLAVSHPRLFKPVDAHYTVEQMTAAPGEKRGDAA